MLFRRLILILKQPAEKQKQKTLRLSAISDVLLYIWFISKNNMAAKVLQSVGYETQQASRLEFKKETNERMNELTKRLQFLFSFKETLGCVSWVIAVMVFLLLYFPSFYLVVQYILCAVLYIIPRSHVSFSKAFSPTIYNPGDSLDEHLIGHGQYTPSRSVFLSWFSDS